jgi:hypothetical protein
MIASGYLIEKPLRPQVYNGLNGRRVDRISLAAALASFQHSSAPDAATAVIGSSWNLMAVHPSVILLTRKQC